MISKSQNYNGGSKMRRTSQKFQVFGLGIFLSIAKAMVYSNCKTLKNFED